ncbi:MAG: drug/metabolite transporter (DMT)-like permease [Motiliproteus sp.]|jgi:drug/metabolite transporter (DMT)-like permease
MPLSAQIRADLVLLLVTLLAAAGWIFSKQALVELPPLLFMGLRFLLAGSVLLLFCRDGWQQVKEQRVLVSLVGLGCLMAAALFCWILGLQRSLHLGTGAFIASLGILLVPLMAWLLYRERAPRSTWLSLLVALSGLALLFLEKGVSLTAGQGWFLMAALLFSVHFTLISRFAVAIPTVILTAIQLLVVGVLGIMLSALGESWPSTLSWPTLGWFLASALIATSVRFALQTYAQSLAPASHVALIMTLEPVWAALLAGLWYGERMTWMQFAGSCLIFSAMFISRWYWVKRAMHAFTRDCQEADRPLS